MNAKRLQWVVVGLFAACGPVPDALELEPLGVGTVGEGGSDGPRLGAPPPMHRLGDAERGARVFRDDTFGNERFWSGVAGLAEGLVASKLTPVGALKLGLSFDVDAMDAPSRKALQKELSNSFLAGPLMNNPATLRLLLEQGAVMGLVVKDTTPDGRLALERGDQIGVTCALCHAITDSAWVDNPAGGSIGHRVDGPAAHTLHLGALLALATHTRAFLPLAKVGGMGKGAALSRFSTEAEVDAWFQNSWARGTFDATPDGVANAVRHAPVFRADLAAPWGSAGETQTLDDYTNGIITVTLDPTRLLTPPGREYLRQIAGADGDRLADEYAAVLGELGVETFGLVDAPRPGAPAGARADEQKLVDLNAYLTGLPAPAGAVVDTGAADRGRVLFRDSAGCTACHNVSGKAAVPWQPVAMQAVFPAAGDALDSAAAFDDRMIFVNAVKRGQPRGPALPVLLDLARKPRFLHDDSVGSLDELLRPSRGPDAPHPFYVADPKERLEVVRFLERLDDTRK